MMKCKYSIRRRASYRDADAQLVGYDDPPHYPCDHRIVLLVNGQDAAYILRVMETGAAVCYKL